MGTFRELLFMRHSRRFEVRDSGLLSKGKNGWQIIYGNYCMMSSGKKARSATNGMEEESESQATLLQDTSSWFALANAARVERMLLIFAV